MKKVFKRAIPFVLVVVMCFCMTVPAFATTPIRTCIADFDTVSYGSYNNYVRVVQRFLSLYDDDWENDIANTGGVDGHFGSATQTAVKEFQELWSLTKDGVVGYNTWYRIANCMSIVYDIQTNPIHSECRRSGEAVLWLFYLHNHEVCSETIWNVYDGSTRREIDYTV